MSKQPPSDHEDDPFKPTPEEERYLAFKARAIRGALGLQFALSDAAEALTLVEHAQFAVGIYPDDESPDGFGLLVLKGEEIADDVMHAPVPTVPWTAIPLASYRVAELVRRMISQASPVIFTPTDELTGAVLDAGFDEVERIATGRGIDREGFVVELLSRAVDGLWDDEDREALRTKAHAAVSASVDALFDGLGDARVAA